MNTEFSVTISIPADDQGYVLLKCEYCGDFFKISSTDLHDERILHIFCPSCGLVSASYITDEVIELAVKKFNNKMNEMIVKTFKDLERHNKNGLIKFKVDNKAMYEVEDPIRSGIDSLEICEFPCCKRTAKIKPLLKMTGAYCPFCGVKNYEIK